VLLPWFKATFNGELRVFIQPQRMTLFHLTRPLKLGLKQQLVQKKIIELPFEVGANTDFNQQQVIIQALAQVLTSEQWRGLAASVVLSNHYAHFIVIPWNTELVAENERQAFMLHCFTQAYGEAAKTWNLRMSNSSFGKAAIASAIPQSFLQELHTVFSGSGMVLTAVHPHIMLAVNQTLSEVKKRHQVASFWLVTILAGQICLALYESGQWRSIKNVTLDVDVSAQVGALIRREMVNSNIQENLPKFLYWPESSYTQPMMLGGFEMIKIMPAMFDLQNKQSKNTTSLVTA